MLLRRSSLRRATTLAAVAAVALTGLATPAAAGAAPTPVDPAVASAPGLVGRTSLPAPGVTPGRALAGARTAAAGHDLTFGLRRGQSLVPQGSSTTQPSTIVSFDLPPKGSGTPLGGYGTYLVLQSDGDLVEYETTTGKVLFTAGGKRAVRFTYQADGNAVLYGPSSEVLFQTRTAGDKVGTYLLAYGNGQLLVQSDAGKVVTAFGTAVVPSPGVVTRFADSPNGRYEVALQPSGDLAAYDVSTATPRLIWHTNTAGRGKARLAVQSNGNLVLSAYPSGTVLWTSRSKQSGAAYYQLDMKNTGNVVLYRTSGGLRTTRVWASGSAQN